MSDEIVKAFESEIVNNEEMYSAYQHGYFKGAESRQPEIDELKEIILKIRNNRFEPDKIDILWHKSLKIGR